MAKFKGKILIIIAVIAAIIFTYLIYGYISLKQNLKDPDYIAKLQTESQSTTKDEILSKLGKIYLLPDESDPQIATISDVNTLKEQNEEFYKNAQNEDTLILYSSLAIIYRDSINKIINVAPIISDEN